MEISYLHLKFFLGDVRIGDVYSHLLLSGSHKKVEKTGEALKKCSGEKLSKMITNERVASNLLVDGVIKFKV